MKSFLSKAGNHLLGGLAGLIIYPLAHLIISSKNNGKKIWTNFFLEFMDFWRHPPTNTLAKIAAIVVGVPIEAFIAGFLFLGHTLLDLVISPFKGGYFGLKDGLSRLGNHLKQAWKGSEETSEEEAASEDETPKSNQPKVHQLRDSLPQPSKGRDRFHLLQRSPNPGVGEDDSDEEFDSIHGTDVNFFP